MLYLRVVFVLLLVSCMTLVRCELIKGPADVLEVKGATIILPCSTNLHEPVRWEFKRFDAQKYEILDIYYTGNPSGVVNIKGRYCITVDSTGSEYNLTIYSVQTEDAGTYRCMEESRSIDDGAPDQRSAEVVVADDFSCLNNVVLDPRTGLSVQLHVGYTINMSCTLSNIIGNINPKLRWSVIKDDSYNEMVLFHPESRTFYNTEGRNKTMTSEIRFLAIEGLNKTFVRCNAILRDKNSLNFGMSLTYPNAYWESRTILVMDYFIGPSLFDEYFTADYLIVCDARYPGLFQVEISTGNVRLLSSDGMSKPVAVDIDPVNMDVYFTDVVERSMSRFSIKTKQTQVIYQDLEGKPIYDGLALDMDKRSMYISDAKMSFNADKIEIERFGSIIEIGLNGKFFRTIFNETGISPRALQLDKKNSMLFFTDWGGKSGGIYKISLMGSHMKIPIITTGLVWPNALVVDFITQEMFWADAHTDVVETSGLDGSNRRVLRQFEHHIFGMTLSPEYVYFTDWEAMSVGLYDRENKEFLHYTKHSFKHLHGITLYQSGGTN